MQLRHTGIVVRDIDICVDFYAHFGLVIKSRDLERGDFLKNILSREDARAIIVKLSDDHGCIIELLQFVSPKSRRRERCLFDTGISHIALTVDHIDDEYEPRTSPDGKVRVAFITDPEGNVVELVEELE